MKAKNKPQPSDANAKPRPRKKRPKRATAAAATPAAKPRPPRTREPAQRPRTRRRAAPPEVDTLAWDIPVSSEEAPELGIGSRMVPPHQNYGDPPDSSQPPPRPGSTDVEAQIRALEARLDGLIRRSGPDDANAFDADFLPPSSRSASEGGAEARADGPEIRTSDHFAKYWSPAGLRQRVEDVDDFGLDPEFERKLRPAVDFLYRRYFRSETFGIENVPREGRCVVVANHSGALPFDGPVLRTAFRLSHSAQRDLRWLAEDFIFYLPFAGVFMNRVGAVRACPENAERLLEKESLVAVFPEGVQGIKKLYSDRYQLQRFGRGGYIRLCLRMQAPIVPCAIIGGEEASPLIYRVETLAKLIGLPYIPITPTFPLLGPLGLLPAPSKWKIRFGEPIAFDNYGPEAADDHVLVSRLSERVRNSIQGLLDAGLRERQSVWFG